MNWLDKLERKFGRYAIRNLPLYIVMLYAIGAVLNILTKGSYYYYVALNPVYDTSWTDLETAWFPYCATECKSHFYYFCTDVLLFDWRIFSTGMGSISL